MKNGFWDRVLIFLYVLLTVALVVLVALQAFGIDLIGPFYDGLADQAPGIVWKLIVCGIGAIIALLGVFVVMAIIPERKAEREFITLTNDENGQVRIALPALHEMAAQAVGDAAGVKDMDVSISDGGDAVMVAISLDIVSGTHVPTVTMNMQRAVRSYIQMNCGVAVKDVSVVINSVLPATEAEGAKPVSEPEEAKAVPAPEDGKLEPFEESAEETVPVEEEASVEDSAEEPAPIEEASIAEEREVIFEPTILPDEASAEIGEIEESEEPDEDLRDKAE